MPQHTKTQNPILQYPVIKTNQHTTTGYQTKREKKGKIEQ